MMKKLNTITPRVLADAWRERKKARGFEPSGELGHVSLNIEVPARQSTKMCTPGRLGIKVRTDSKPAAAETDRVIRIAFGGPGLIPARADASAQTVEDRHPRRTNNLTPLRPLYGGCIAGGSITTAAETLNKGAALATVPGEGNARAATRSVGERVRELKRIGVPPGDHY